MKISFTRKYYKCLKYILLLMIFFNVVPLSLNAEDFKNNKKLIIYLDEDADDIKKFAAYELQKHLFLITDILVEIKNNKKNINVENISFFVGLRPINKVSKILEPEESRYIIDNNKVYIFGNDKIIKQGKDKLTTVVNMRNQTGTLFAVYDFLFNELGVRWVEPGDKGIIYKKQLLKKLNDNSFVWSPKYDFRGFRNTGWKWRYLNNKKIKMSKNVPNFFQFTKQEVEKRDYTEGIWKRRMKLGRHSKPKYGHAFTKYWSKYGNEHPDWFALDSFGFRGVTILNRIKGNRVKFCVSNIEVQKEIVDNLSNSKPGPGHYYNACINDSKGYCLCEDCKALDSKINKKSMTNRYVYFWNQLLQKMKKYDRDAKLVVYAYGDCSDKPINEDNSPDVVVGIVPKYTDSLLKTKNNFLGWKESGMKNYFLRPNDFSLDIGLPMGNEKYIYDRYTIYKSSQMLGLDYDRSNNLSNWDLNGIGQYILARGISDDKTYVELENEYFDTFGNAKKEMGAYYKFWRNLFDIKQMRYMQANKVFRKKIIYKNINSFYKEENFIYADKILDIAIQKVSDNLIKNRIRRIKLANEHAQLIFKALINNDKKTSCHLYNFRQKHILDLDLSWPILFSFEKRYNIQNYCIQ